MITETITKAIADTGIANPISTTPTIERRPIFNGNEAFIFNDVTSSSVSDLLSSKGEELCEIHLYLTKPRYVQYLFHY